MNYLHAAAETIQNNMERDAAETIIYRRKGVFSFPMLAIPGRTIITDDQSTGLFVRTISKDFTIRRSNLQGYTPERNDEIVMRIGDQDEIYTVNGDSGMSHFDESDPFGVAYRIHTKRDKIDA